MVYLASRSSDGLESISTSAECWREQELVTWERKTAQWARELIQQDRYEEVDKELRLRSERSPDSPLFLIHARVLESLGRIEAARQVLYGALADWPPAGSQTERSELLLLLVRVLIGLDERSEAWGRLLEAKSAISRAGNIAEQRLEAAILAIRVAPGESGAAKAREELAGLAASWRESEFRRTPELARSRGRVARLPAWGGGADHPRRRPWDDRPGSGGAAGGRICRMGAVSFVPPRSGRGPRARRDCAPGRRAGDSREASLSEAFWRRWFETTPAEEVGKSVSRMLQTFPLTASAAMGLREALLGRDAVIERRASEALTAEARLSRQELFQQAHALLLDSFDLSELGMLLRFNFDTRIDDITAASSYSKAAFDILRYAEQRGMLLDLLRAAAKIRPHRKDWAEFLHRVEESERGR